MEVQCLMQSMTGFGRGTHSTGEWLANVEASSINRKQLEIVANLPRPLLSLEARVRSMATSFVSRGRVQIAIRIEKSEAEQCAHVKVNAELAKSFETAFLRLSEVLDRELLPSPADFLRQPGIFEIGVSEEVEPEAAWEAISPALEQAIARLNEMRATEGKHLQEDFIERLATLARFTQEIAEHAPSRPERHREQLLKRLIDMDLPLTMDDDRLVRELSLFADRCDISEEITRLESHFAKFDEYLHAEDASGRSLDFLCQELFREFNTIGSKANDAGIAQTVVAAKTELEKLREQVQNIE